MARHSAEQRQQALSTLRKVLRPGMTVYTILRHVSASGMSHSISLVTVGPDGDVRQWDWLAASVLGESINERRGGVKVSGCGMDMGFDLVYRLGSALWPNGTPEPHGTRNGEPDTEGGYALKQRWL